MSTTDTTVVTGQIARVLFEAPDGPFAAITITTEAGSIRAVGALAGVTAGQQVRLTGAWRTHPRHGKQFNVESVTAVDPVGERGAIAYLSRVPGIGKSCCAVWRTRSGGV